ncbi:hypothetical protein ACN27F_19015 [Solwaraspora sp. WMMB335]|uniref:hypothetical protein n=1 Tax=Solwaraspora sp. WMMB335 TaxID=3404118 RepID=UPI003B93378B
MRIVHCRAAARAIGRADRSRAVRLLLRPRFISGVCRRRPPLAWQIWAADRGGRLIWRSPDAFCLLRPPAGPISNRPGRLAGWIVEYWPAGVAATASAASLTAAAVVSTALRHVSWSVTAVLALILAALLVYMLFMVVYMTREAVAFVRGFGHRRHIDRVLDQHWSVELLHVADWRQTGPLMAAAERVASGDAVLVDLRRISTAAAQQALADHPYAHRAGPGEPAVVVFGEHARLADPRTRRISMVPGLLLLVFVATLGLFWSADAIVETERALCPDGCADRPNTLPNALYWLTSHLLPFSPDGIEAKSWQTRILGICWSLFSLLVLVTGINLMFQRAVSSNETAGVDLVASFNTDRDAVDRAMGDRAMGDRAIGGLCREDRGVEDRTAARPGKLPSSAWFAAGLAAGAAITATVVRCCAVTAEPIKPDGADGS